MTQTKKKKYSEDIKEVKWLREDAEEEDEEKKLHEEIKKVQWQEDIKEVQKYRENEKNVFWKDKRSTMTPRRRVSKRIKKYNDKKKYSSK